jgi:glycosyltransferase involved in cell wall biosynthesis
MFGKLRQESLRVALVHDWLLGMRGGERLLEELCRMFPKAVVYAFLHRPGAVSRDIERHPIRVSALNRLPGVHRHHRATLPVLPLAAELMRIADCDLVLSTSHCVARSIKAPPGVPHVCICLTPMRYLWGMETPYVGTGWRRAFFELLARPLRAWDRHTESRVDHFVAISEHVRERIARAYHREAEVVYPPVDTDRFVPTKNSGSYFLVVSALVPYKRIDVVVEAFRGRTEELWIAGDGPLLARLRSAAPPNVRFLGWVGERDLPGIVARCRAFLFPTEDEFGIAAVEAQAAGRPVIALGRGGACETVVPPDAGGFPTGLWFDEQTPEAVSKAVERFLEIEFKFEPAAIRAHALRFSRERFRSEILGVLERALGQSGSSRR